MNHHHHRPLQLLIPSTEVDRIVQQEVAKAIRIERRRNRKINRWIWFISLLIAVAVAATLRRQKFTAELEWYWVPLVAVPINGFCFWLGNKMYFGNNK